MRETMVTGRVVYVLSLEIVGNSTSTTKAWSSESTNALSRDEIWARSSLQCGLKLDSDGKV